jgi:hypothetical protein
MWRYPVFAISAERVAFMLPSAVASDLEERGL